jgi:hypothetical protein
MGTPLPIKQKEIELIWPTLGSLNPIWVNLALKGLNHGYLENEVLNQVQNRQKSHRGRSDQVPKSRPFWPLPYKCGKSPQISNSNDLRCQTVRGHHLDQMLT